DLLGMGVGHVYYFLDDVWPRTGEGRPRLLRAPEFVKRMFEDGDRSQVTSEALQRLYEGERANPPADPRVQAAQAAENRNRVGVLEQPVRVDENVNLAAGEERQG
ncbi:hypothetical protein HDU96_009961, partial [Phlyctochytrium bullatum]